MLLTPHVSRRTCLLASTCLLAGTALAREFWLQPAAFFVVPGTRLRLEAVVGDNFAGEQWTGKSSRIISFCHRAPGAAPHNLLRAATTSADTVSPTILLAQPGTHLVALATSNAFTTLKADDFNAYLRAESLTEALALRERRHETTRPGREAYRRCATTLLQVGPASAPDTARHWARPVGLPLELVAEQNPYLLLPGAALTVRVLLAGQPLAGQLVRVQWHGARPSTAGSQVRSNQNGRALFRLSEPGEYLVSTVHMTPISAGSGADWQSTWSTLTFGLSRQKRP